MQTAKLKPAWAGGEFLSRFVNLLIHTGPTYALLKRQARKVLIKTAEKNGIAWRQRYRELEMSGIQQTLDQNINPAVVYPDYYKKPFHAYAEGNLCWQAAFEAEPATYAMALRIWPGEKLTWQDAHDRLRTTFHTALAEQGVTEVHDILDIGCSVGISTLSLHRYFQGLVEYPVSTIGLDLSPYMLAVARAYDARHEIAAWLHAAGEASGLMGSSFDLVSLQLVAHELPRDASRKVLQEASRLLKPGGWIALLDSDPGSPVLQKLPPFLFTLMKSTEPWSDDYYTFDLQAALETAGFEKVVSVASDPRHRTIIARKPV
ncbi:MAG TPA: class I SAM-dependent methyltransferase [Chloroflexia bacterium]|nr:class I SAM-dependent methyltransferase [Chloroflexia bacterium]